MKQQTKFLAPLKGSRFLDVRVEILLRFKQSIRFWWSARLAEDSVNGFKVLKQFMIAWTKPQNQCIFQKDDIETLNEGSDRKWKWEFQ